MVSLFIVVCIGVTSQRVLRFSPSLVKKEVGDYNPEGRLQLTSLSGVVPTYTRVPRWD